MAFGEKPCWWRSSLFGRSNKAKRSQREAAYKAGPRVVLGPESTQKATRLPPQAPRFHFIMNPWRVAALCAVVTYLLFTAYFRGLYHAACAVLGYLGGGWLFAHRNALARHLGGLPGFVAVHLVFALACCYSRFLGWAVGSSIIALFQTQHEHEDQQQLPPPPQEQQPALSFADSITASFVRPM